MYQESSGVDNAEYHHIMYNYETLKLPPEAAAALKMTGVVEHDAVTLSGSDSLPTVTLSAGESLVPSCISTSLPVTNVLTTTSLSESVRLAAPSLSIAAPLTCTSITNGIPLSAVSLTPTNSPSTAASVVPSGHFTDGSVPSTLTVATMSEVDSSSVNARDDSLEIGQIVHNTNDGVLESNLVSSSSMDAVVTSMVASADCQGVVTNARKIPSQVIAKLLGDDSLSLDMVRIITEQDVESVSHQSQGFNMLTRPGMLVHTKLTDNDIVSANGINPYRHVEVVNVRPTIRLDNEGPSHCSVLWTCAYCNMAFTSSEAVGQHQEKECTENQNITVAATSSSSAVESLISPLRQVEDNTYGLKLSVDKATQNDKEEDTPNVPSKMEEQPWDSEHESIWTCAICESEFHKAEELGKHYLAHSIEDLSASLLKLTKPQNRPKVCKTSLDPSPSSVPVSVPSTIVLEQKSSSSETVWNKSVRTTIEEEMADNPGDTPPQTPPLESLTAKVKKKTSPRATSGEKNEKKKGGKKATKETKTPRQPKNKGQEAGQGSRAPHTCHICKKVLSCRGNLAKHLVTHESDKPFHCKPCNLGFNAKRDQQYHYLRYHTNERPNICEICGKGYVFKQYLLKHMVFHEKERQFSCEICGKQFLTSKCVRRHKKRHKKERPFKCTICLKSFTVNADLKAHIRKIHRNNKKSSNGKQEQDTTHKVTQVVQQLQHKPPDSQSLKSKDIAEFLLPSSTPISAQLLPTDLEPATLSGSVSSKDEVFIAGDPLGAIIPLSDMPTGDDYSTSVAPIGDHTTYVMINSTEEEVTSQNVSTAHGLNIMYAAATAPVQQVGGLGQSQLSQNDLSQGQHMLVSSSLGADESQLSRSTMQHVESQTDIQHQVQETQVLGREAELNEGHEGDIGVPSSADEHGSALAAATHDSVVHSSHDPSSGFHLELLSQTIQLEFQRTPTTSANYLGISDR